MTSQAWNRTVALVGLSLLSACGEAAKDHWIDSSRAHFSIQIEGRSAADISRVLTESSAAQGLKTDPKAKIGLSFGLEGGQVLASFEDPEHTFVDVSVYQYPQKQCVDVQTMAWEQASSWKADRIDGAFRAALEKAFPGIRLSDQPCVTAEN